VVSLCRFLIPSDLAGPLNGKEKIIYLCVLRVFAVNTGFSINNQQSSIQRVIGHLASPSFGCHSIVIGSHSVVIGLPREIFIPLNLFLFPIQPGPGRDSAAYFTGVSSKVTETCSGA